MQPEDDVERLVWEKLICNVCFSGTCTVLERTIGEVLDDPHAWSVASACAREAYEVSAATGIAIGFDDPVAYAAAFRGANPRRAAVDAPRSPRRSTYRVDAINGAIPPRADALGLAAPVNAAVTAREGRRAGLRISARLHAVSDEFVLDTPTVRGFVEHVRQSIDASDTPEEAIDAIRPRFADLLADDGWLPAQYAEPAEDSGMGGGIGQWLLYRTDDGSLSLFSLVVPSESRDADPRPPGVSAGLYRGNQDEEIYAQRNGALEAHRTACACPGRLLRAFIPLRDDIHRVRTTSGWRRRLPSTY